MRKSETQAIFQVGKNGVSEGTIDSLTLAFKNHKQVRISVLKSARNSREDLKKIAEEIQASLKVKTIYKLIGYTIILIKR